MDTSKHVFQLHGVNAPEQPVLRKKLRRKEMLAFFEKLAPTVIAIEACGASHHWARQLQSFGHSVRLIAPQLVKPNVKRGKNDAADAEALCEAMSRPAMRFVPVKTVEQQAALMLVGVRDRLIRNRTQLANAIRGYAMEFGLTAAKGMAHLDPLLERIQADNSLPALCHIVLYRALIHSRCKVTATTRRNLRRTRENPVRRGCTVCITSWTTQLKMAKPQAISGGSALPFPTDCTESESEPAKMPTDRVGSR